MADDHVLDNPIWHALSTTQAGYAQVHGRARRFDPEVAAFAAVDELDEDAWSDLAALAEPGAVAVLARRRPFIPGPGWTSLFAAGGDQMMLERPVEVVERPPGLRELTVDDVPEMLELVRLTEPGPFAPRTVELGGYQGIFEDGRLLAMAGQRMNIEGYTEISAVCTHPDARRRGYAATLTSVVAAGIAAAGKTPILHVSEHNEPARRVYEALGFKTRARLAFAALRAP